MDIVRKIQLLVEENKSLKHGGQFNSTHVIMASRLKKMGVNYAHIKPIFDIPTTVLSGGLIVQTMLGEYWHTDIDIFTTNPKAVIKTLVDAFPYWTEKPTLIPVSSASHYNAYNNKVYRGQYTKGVYIEIVQSSSIWRDIQDFDLDFCKCYFDGHKFHTFNEVALTTKTHRGPVIGYGLGSKKRSETIKESRIKKYEMRGFTIIPDLVPDRLYADDDYAVAVCCHCEKPTCECPHDNNATDDSDVEIIGQPKLGNSPVLMH